LTKGPGKTKPDNPGWTEEASLNIDQHIDGSINHDHSHEVGVEVNPDNLMRGALGVLAGLGIITIPDASPIKTLDESEKSSNNGTTDNGTTNNGTISPNGKP
jgi:hypothetical protein